MVLKTLEFSECLFDSPTFREKLHQHEKELDKTSKSMKSLINDFKDLLKSAREYSAKQKNFGKALIDFKFETIGEETDDEKAISKSLYQFGTVIHQIEEARAIMLDKADEQFLQPLESFRKTHIGGAKESRKKFENTTKRFNSLMSKHLSLKPNVGDSTLNEADTQVEAERRQFFQSSMMHVKLLQEVQERKKFDFVEILLVFMYQWFTFYHQGHEIFKDFNTTFQDLSVRLSKTRENFNCSRDEVLTLLNKTLDMSPDSLPTKFTREGYLYMMEKKTLQLGTAWTRVYCQYQKDHKLLSIIQFNNTNAKLSSNPEMFVLTSCTRRAHDSIEKRFCFDITVQDKPGQTITFQASSEQDRRLWLDAMDGKEPVYLPQNTAKNVNETSLNDAGFEFMKAALAEIEKRGLEEQGLYRVVGVLNKVNKCLQAGLNWGQPDKALVFDEDVDTKTLTSAVKSFLRYLPEPLMTFDLYEDFIKAAKNETYTLRVHDIHVLVHKLPDSNFEMLDILVKHLQQVILHNEKNMMNTANVGVCFGPCIMRAREETMQNIIDIKFCNILVEILCDNYEKIFLSNPEGPDGTESKITSRVKRKITPQRPSAEPPLPPDTSTIRQSRGMSKPKLTPLRTTASNPVGHKKSSLESNSPTSPSTPTTPNSMFSNNHSHNLAQIRKSLRPTASFTPVQGA